nr:Ig-like domain-containing protein [uncultured Pseudomonas sp.]
MSSAKDKFNKTNQSKADAARVEAARVEAERIEAARLEAERVREAQAAAGQFERSAAVEAALEHYLPEQVPSIVDLLEEVFHSTPVMEPAPPGSIEELPEEAWVRPAPRIATRMDDVVRFNAAVALVRGTPEGLVSTRALTVDAELPIPFPPAVLFDIETADFGLNRAAVHLRPLLGLAVMVQSYSKMRAGDLVEIMWHPEGQTALPVLTVIVNAEQAASGEDISTYVPSERAVPGVAQWYMRVTRAGSNNAEESDRITLFYKDTLPGGPDLRPEEAWHSELHPAQLTLPEQPQPGQFARVQLDPYPFMRVRDVITISIGGIQVTYVIPTGHNNEVIAFDIDMQKLLPILEQPAVYVVWRVHDEVHNLSEKWSGLTILGSEVPVDGMFNVPELYIGNEWIRDELSLTELGMRDAQLRAFLDPSMLHDGDLVELTCEGLTADGQTFVVPLEPVVVTDVEQQDHPYFLFRDIPNAHLRAAAMGMLHLSYQITRQTQVIGNSQSAVIVVKGEVAKLPAPNVSEAVGGNVDRSLPAITVVVAWPGMTVNDQVKVMLVGRSAGQDFDRTHDLGKVTLEDQQRGYMRHLLAEPMSALDGGTLSVRYEVSQVDGVARPSDSLELTVGVPAALWSAPQVTGAAQGPVRPRLPVFAWVPPEVSLLAGDKVRFDWVGRTAQASHTAEVEVTLPNRTELLIPAQVVLAGEGQVVKVSYRVTASDGSVRGRSSERVVVVADVVQWDRRAPVSLEAERDPGNPSGWLLDPAKVPLAPGATFTVNYLGMLPLDTLALVVQAGPGAPAFRSAVQTVDRVGALTFHVPRSVILASLGNSITVHYERRLLGQGPVDTSLPLQLRVAAAAIIDPSEMILNGRSVKFPSWPRSGLQSPGNSQARVPVGQGSYTYQSSNPAVAVVDQKGLVVGQRNGTATITVTSATGEKGSYTVTVSNVYALWLLQWAVIRAPGAVSGMYSRRGSPARPDVIDDLHRQYANPLPGMNRGSRPWACYTNSGGSYMVYDGYDGLSKPWNMYSPQAGGYMFIAADFP